MRYERYSNDDCLAQTFKEALEDQQNIVLQAGTPQQNMNDFAVSVSNGLRRNPRQLECRFLYDPRGSELYDLICEQPEYYPTRTEAGILNRHAEEIGRRTGSCHLVELGSGSSLKTDHLLSAYQSLYRYLCYTPIDISARALELAGRQILQKRPAVQIVGIHGTYTDSLQVLSCASPALIIFLGSTLGNFTPDEEQGFWQDITASMEHGDYFLLGLDLVKEVPVMEAAYNDAAGITAAFTRNYLARMNRELGSGVDLDTVDHVAFFNPDKRRVEIYLQFNQSQDICLTRRGECFAVQEGERILIEISRKFDLQEMQSSLEGHGFRIVRTYTDEKCWFGLLLLQKD